jgi:hypothetical protein
MLLLVLSLCVAWPTAVFSKENGILMVLFALVVEASLMAAGAKRRPMREAYGYFAIGLLPFVAALGQLVIDPAGIVGGYGGRDFTLVERLLTESRVLWLYVGLIVFPDVRSMSLYHDDFLVSTGLLEPGTTLLAIAAWGILLGCAIAWRRRVPLLFFAVSWFLMGHLVESTIIPLLLVQEHRNYVPQIGLLLPAAIILCQKTASLRGSWLPVTLVAMLLAMTTANRAATWGDYGRFVVHGIVNHPGSVTTHTNAIKYFTDRAGREPGIAMELYDKALFHVRELQRTDPDNGAQTGLYRLIIEGRLAMGGQLENAIVESPHLLSALKESRLTPLDVNLLGHAVNCTVTRSCDIAPRYLEEVLTAALDSGKNGGHSRAYLFGARADLRFAVLRDLGGAIDDLEQSSRLDPRVGSYTQRWIELLILAGRYGEAKAALERFGARLTPSAVSLIEREIRSREAGQP